MKKNRNYLVGLLIAGYSLFAVSCDDTEGIIADPNAEFDVVLELDEAGSTTGNEDITVDPATETEIKAKVVFTTSSKDMKRLYITQNIQGAGETIYKPTESVDLKADESIGLENSLKNKFEFAFDLPVPADLSAEGTVVYKFWATTGNGDFRDVNQRLALGAGTITLKLGTAANPEADVKSFTSVKLFAPTANGLSKTFVSLLDGNTYDVKSGSEYAAFWDFGYIYRIGAPAGAGFTSTYDYPTIAVDVPTVSGTPKEELNKSYFVISAKTTAEFDAIETTTDLNFVTPNTANAQVIGGLAVGSVIEFIDAYGKKGLIKVKQINGTNGSDGFIIVDIKVQP